MMNSTSLSILQTNERYSSAQDRCRRGSLPLKKRRFSLEREDETTSSCTTNGTLYSLGNGKVFPHAILAPLSEQPVMMVAGNDEKIAALALVAAAASAFAPIPNYFSTPNVDLTHKVQAYADIDMLEAAMDVRQELVPTAPPKRINRPALSSPLPGGCHGRTSRNNSYCRRHPCFNGSKYCKLHYQHYIVAGIRTPLDEEEGEETSSVYEKTTKSSQLAVAHQDKRYMGAAGETRCLATTTRGRVCAYISVNGSKYCYLHSDYDINPPPKRSSNKIKVSGPIGGSPFRLGPARHLSSLPSVPSAISAAEVSLASPPSVASEESRIASPVMAVDQGKRWSSQGRRLVEKSPRKGSRRNSSKLAEKHAESPFPLLSMISTDQWYHKTVMIAAGPLANRVGRVEKWGNGWVSVDIEGVGLHNRRSFELYLHSEDEEAEAVSINEAEGQAEDAKGRLMRCVSREAVSPSPAFARSPAKVPETPRPSRDNGDMLDTALATPVPSHSESTSQNVPQVTPVALKKLHPSDDVPLVETLQLVQQGNAAKYNFDMLFGTAALERGRRTLKKVTRYEDTAMLSNKKEKEHANGKRKRSDA